MIEVGIYKVACQYYLTPFIKVTHSRLLNGHIELIFGWLNRELVISKR